MDNTKNKVLSGLVWKFGERISIQLVTFVVSVVLARLLPTEAYGLITLVAQYLTNTTIDTIVLAITIKWKPELTFSFKSLKELFRYGWKY